MSLTPESDRGKNKASSKSFEAMRKFSEKYAKNTGTFFCADPSVTNAVIEGLAKHKDDLGFPLSLSLLRRQGSRSQRHILELSLCANA